MVLGLRLSSRSSSSIRKDLLKYADPALIVKVPDYIERPPYYETGKPVEVPELDHRDPDQRLQHERGMRRSNTLAAFARSFSGTLVKPGITTVDIDNIVFKECMKRSFYPAPINYRNFPKSIVTSVNEVICHGIPDKRILEAGDVVKIDCSAYWKGFFGDCCGTFFVGEPSDSSRKLAACTRMALDSAISVCSPGAKFHRIGWAIEEIADEHGFGVVPNYCGHGIGQNFHGQPSIFHVRNEIDFGVMEPGMTFTIEPMLTIGNPETEIWEDGWSVATRDGSMSAQIEETILITNSGAEILTVPAKFVLESQTAEELFK